MMPRVLPILICVLLFIGGDHANAQEYPSKVITIIVPFSAGGPSDTIARLLAQTMSAPLKTQVIVENVAGAGGTIGAARVAQASPDGYTLFVHHIGHATAPALYRQLTYNPVTDFEPVGLINDGAMTLVARKDFTPKNLKELIAHVKANKDKVNLANAGVGSASHLAGLLFMNEIETDITTIPYKGTGPAMNDLLGGQVDFMIDQTTNTTSHIKAGKIQVYAVTTAQRLSSLPEVPTMHEAGLPNYKMTVWHALYAPKGTPKPIIDKLVKALQEGLKDSNLKQRYAELGAETVAQDQATPEALRAHLKAQIELWGPIIKKAGVYAD
ncbi:MAG TPA: tripartite tricarboxylate transporter substrate-binding protein [Desulfobacterales bacterium]|nr:tripartite tricarboxylate transporter substrate-binding protein [Desulfobacterales bacterium]